MRKNDKKEKQPRDAAWELFEKTGNVSHYLLYKQLTDGKD
ncbi:MAG: YqzL family protein [Clostridia bacterium]|nr:YqzL family protein [Clostridia bacterium]